MDSYYVNNRAQLNGDHEVHTGSCRIYLRIKHISGTTMIVKAQSHRQRLFIARLMDVRFAARHATKARGILKCDNALLIYTN